MPPSKKFKTMVASLRIPAGEFDFVTVTIHPSHNMMSPNGQMYCTKVELLKHMNKWLDDFSGVVELTKEGNVHYHFWAVSDIQKFKYFFIGLKKLYKRKVLGFYCLSRKNAKKTIEQQRIDAYNYLKKDLDKTYELLKSDCIVYNKNNTKIDIPKDDNTSMNPFFNNINLDPLDELYD